MSGHRERKLIVTGQKPITNMKLRNGGTATIYEVFAKTPEGQYVEEALRSFTELDIGQSLVYKIEPYNHPVHGMSYTLHPPKKEFPRRMREAEERLDAVTRWAEAQGFSLSRWSRTDGPPPTADEIAAAETRKRKEDEDAADKFGDDAPWTSGEELGQILDESTKGEVGGEEAAGGDPDVPDQEGAPGPTDGDDQKHPPDGAE